MDMTPSEATPSSTAATPAGTCVTCGGQLYTNLTHYCGTTNFLEPRARPRRWSVSGDAKHRYLNISLGDGRDITLTLTNLEAIDLADLLIVGGLGAEQTRRIQRVRDAARLPKEEPS